MRAGGFPGNPGGLVVSIVKTAGARAPAHQARGRGRRTWRPTERTAGARMVPPGEGNEARGDGRRGVGVSHSTAEAGELSPRDPVEGRGHRQVAPLEGKTANTPRLGPVSTSRQRIAELARQAVGMAVAIAWLPGPAGTRRRVAKLSVEEPDAAEPARPDLWGARVSNDPGLPDRSAPKSDVSTIPSSNASCSTRGPRQRCRPMPGLPRLQRLRTSCAGPRRLAATRRRASSNAPRAALFCSSGYPARRTRRGGAASRSRSSDWRTSSSRSSGPCCVAYRLWRRSATRMTIRSGTLAGHVLASREGRAVRLRASQDIVPRISASHSLLSGKTIEQAVTARSPQLFLAATTAVMGGVPSCAVMMTEPGFSVTAARPVVAGHVLASREGRAVRLRASQDIVPVRNVSAAGDPSASLVDHRHDSKPMSHAVKLLDVITDKNALSVMPWACADAVASIHRVRTLRAEVGAPGAVAGTHFGGQALTERVGSSQTTQIGSIAGADACDEKPHRLLLSQPAHR